MNIRIKTCTELPTSPNVDTVYHLSPVERGDAHYWERVDRNIGWITEDEQHILSKAKIRIAGCGGMGGMLGSIFKRAGVGELGITDRETFDLSNLNRQFAARQDTVGKSKAFETARMLRQITDDTNIIVYPQGICEETVDHFLEGCDAVCDEIEFWAVGARVLLHQRARERNIPIFNGDTVGFVTHLFLFTPQSMRVEEILGLSLEEAVALEQKIRDKTATENEVRRVMDIMLHFSAPELHEYCPHIGGQGNKTQVLQRLFEEQKASIIATNPPMASGFVANHVLLHLLKDSGTKREYVAVPEMPGYLSFDAARMSAKVVQESW